MQRCRHKKSRKGCLECKRRHIRCDEGRPICANCISARRKCEYRKPNASDQDVASRLPPLATLGLSPGAGVANLNMHQLELLVHFSFAIYVPELEEDHDATKLVLEAALNAEYLMLEVLALSARHLSAIRPDKAAWYLDLAFELQTKAIRLFNTNAAQDESVQKLLFSSILGRHILVDTLVSRDLEFDQFLDRFIQGMRVHRGTKAVMAAYEWEPLLNSKIGSLITKGIDPLGFHDPGSLRPHLESLISQATRLDADGKLACDKALRMIEGALDDLESPERNKFGLRMIFVWPILLPEGFIGLLEQRVPEAIAILGRYAILLQAGRRLWQIKDAGEYLLNLVSAFLGPGWEMWL
ncbi:hypothetical protein NW759_015969 [Fusarium solani]|nr:hypothetical protein NW759_015969 [Fusarium solani]